MTFGPDLGGLNIGLPEQMEIGGGGGGGGNPILGGLLSAGMQGAAGGMQGGGRSPESRANNMRDSLTGFLATSPFKNPEATLGADMQKFFMRGRGFSPEAGTVGQEAWDKLGSSNENILGVNRGIEDFTMGKGQPNVLGAAYEDEGGSFLKKALGIALPVLAKAFLPIPG